MALRLTEGREAAPLPSSIEHVRFQRVGRIGIATLTRPQALNALTLPMVTALAAQLQDWAADDTVLAVVLAGEGRAFCAGGDIRAMALASRALQQGDDAAGAHIAAFFTTEYRLNYTLAQYPKPIVSLIDGICMGGGLGLSVHGSHRIVTEHGSMAMPECRIGFYPDVGGGWFLSRCPGRTGVWAGLTAARLGPAEALHMGLATHMLPHDGLPAFLTAVIDGASIGEALGPVYLPDAPSLLLGYQPMIDRCFDGATVEDIVAALEREADPFAAEQLAALQAMSPTSLKVTLELLQRAESLSLGQELELEYAVTHGFVHGHDFYEGVRAALIDKDHRPQWSPAALEAVDAALVARHFEPVAKGLGL